MADNTHTVTSFETELHKLRAMMAEMGEITQQQVTLALDAITEHEPEAAQKAITLDPRVDALERDVEALAIRMLALRSPMGADLREIVAALKITGDLERIGDYAASIAKRAAIVSEESGNIPLGGLRNMGRLVIENIALMVKALVGQNPTLALEVWHADRAIDEQYTTLFRELVTYMMEDARNIRPCTELLFVARNLERIGDHATNIAERVFYAVTGENMPASRPKGRKVTTASITGEVLAAHQDGQSAKADDAEGEQPPAPRPSAP
ncbi:phosphate signaling complex protein PhoU [Formicincola oecophyllae]|uniref:Phosphate-specific transport system accessory protein PhoU homolog n=1 Tax=Formicincola oecophyllae TaxID=2558361 RepID=A0A4Y6UBH7_9PROT|nr:phosphate signaling complex protein PhoU [Formicincola oecophyllae]QDH13465.1 phosphate signaling complex protein PhoU [Formicincola oecophyllae]